MDNKEKKAINLVPTDEEYKMLRTEILQYLQDYQSVRNMMYVTSIAIFAFLFSQNITEPLIYLSPLVVILPSYICAFNFWRSVTQDSAYLIVFHEERGSSFRWENRHDVFSKKYGGESPFTMNVQSLPYIAMCAMCFVFCLINFYRIHDSFSAFKCNITGFVMTVCCLICIIVFVRYGKLDKEKILNEWRTIRDEEINIKQK